MHASALVDRPQTRGEEVANAVTHGLGALAAVAALPILVYSAAQHGSARNITAVSIFASTMIVLYLVSTIYHALPAGQAKRIFNRLDHGAIFVFIAGSYTPFALGILHGGWGWTLFGLSWGIGAVGLVAKLSHRLKHPLWSTGLYLGMGWLVVVAGKPLFERLSTPGIAWLVAGGLAYTAGALVFLLDNRIRYAHAVWHCFVLAGSACHFFAALWHSS